MQPNLIQDAIEEAKRELSEIAAESLLLHQRRAKLMQLLNGLETYSSPPPNLATADKELYEPQMPVWIWIRSVLQKAEGPLRVPEIYDRLNSNGVKIAGTRPKDVLRIAMLRKPKTFIKIGAAFSLATDQADQVKAEGATEVAP